MNPRQKGSKNGVRMPKEEKKARDKISKQKYEENNRHKRKIYRKEYNQRPYVKEKSRIRAKKWRMDNR